MLRRAKILRADTLSSSGRYASVVAHLFVADDIILFTKTNVREAEAIKQIIWQYESASGQRFNMEKIEITFSANISEEHKQEISNVLGGTSGGETLAWFTGITWKAKEAGLWWDC